MRKMSRLFFIAIMCAAILAIVVPSLLAARPTPIGCGADGYCNPFCVSDPDCVPPQCVPNKPCTNDLDCQPLGFCSAFHLCICTG